MIYVPTVTNFSVGGLDLFHLSFSVFHCFWLVCPCLKCAAIQKLWCTWYAMYDISISTGAAVYVRPRILTRGYDGTILRLLLDSLLLSTQVVSFNGEVDVFALPVTHINIGEDQLLLQIGIDVV